MNNEELVKSAIGKVATGPDLSKDLNLEETEEMMHIVLRGETTSVRQGFVRMAFLV